MKRYLIAVIIAIVLVGVVSADTLIVYTNGTEDGVLATSITGTFTDLRNAAGDTVGTTNQEDRVQLRSHTSTSNNYVYLTRPYTEFNTSTLPDDAVISTANIYFWGYLSNSTTLGSPALGITGFSPATNGTAVAEDYDSFGNVRYASDIPIASWNLTQYNNYGLNAAGIQNISKTGYTNVMWRLSWDIDNDTTGLTWSSDNRTWQYRRQSEYSGTSNDPYIQITYTIPPVAAFTARKFGNDTITSPVSDYPEYWILFNDTSTNTPTSWVWNKTNVTGDNVPVTFSTSKNTTAVFDTGNWSIQLISTNAAGSNTTAPFFVNLSTVNGTAHSRRVFTTNTTDGYTIRSGNNLSWSDVRGGAGTGATTTTLSGIAGVRSAYTTDNWTYLVRDAYIFNTSALPDEATILNATFTSRRYLSTTQLPNSTIGITKFYPSGATVISSDYSRFNDTRYANDINTSNMTTAGFYNWTFNSLGISNISTTGSSGFFMRISWDIDNSFNSTWSSNVFANFQGYHADSLNYPPYITMDYTIGSAPVAAFTATSGSSGYSGYPTFAVNFTDTSTNTPTSWVWNKTNVTGDNVPVTFSTGKHANTLLGTGNWSIKLTATNAEGSNTTPAQFFINLTPCSNATYCKEYYYPRESWSFSHGPDTWPTIRDSTGNSIVNFSTNSVGVESAALLAGTCPSYGELRRIGYTFNTSDIPDTATASSVTMSVRAGYGKWNNQGTTDLNITQFNPANWNSIGATTNYERFTNDSTIGGMAYASYPASGYANFTLSNTTFINKTGMTPLGFRLGYDTYNITPDTCAAGAPSGFYWYGVNYSYGSTYYPFMTVEYSTVSAPVAAFTSSSGSSGTSSYPQYYLKLTDTSTNTPTSWNWTINNVTGNNTPISFSTSQNPRYTITGEGNWSIKLNSTNAGGSNTTPAEFFVNLSACNGGSSCRYRAYGTTDARIKYDPADAATNWSTIRNATTGTSIASPLGATNGLYNGYTATTTTSEGYDYHWRGAISLATDWLPDTATITAAKLEFVHMGRSSALGSVDLSLINLNRVANTTFSEYDYGCTTFTRMANDISYSSLTDYVATNYTLNANGIAAINKTGYTGFLLDSNRSVDNVGFTWASGASAYGMHYSIAAPSTQTTAYPPFLDMNYTTSSPPVANFTATSGASGTSTYPDYAVTFTDTSTNTPTSWQWNATNVTGNNTPVTFSTSQNPSTIFGDGNWSIRLTSTNAGGSNTTPTAFFINLSASAGSSYNRRFYPTYDTYISMYGANQTWTAIRNGAGFAVGTNAGLLYSGYIQTLSTTDTDRYQSAFRSGTTWNTSVLTSAATISSATITLSGDSKGNNFGTWNSSIIDFTPANKESFVAGDYDATTFTRVAPDITYTDFNTTGGNGTNAYSLNAAGLSAINKTALTSFMMTDNFHVDNVSPTWASNKLAAIIYKSGNYTDTTKRPNLTVSYSTGTAPVANFTVFSNGNTSVSNPVSSYPEYLIRLNDTSTNTPTSWQWNKTNVTGDNIPVTFSTAQNPLLQLDTGNWSIRLTATNSVGSNTSAPFFVNLSESINSTYGRRVIISNNTIRLLHNPSDAGSDWYTSRNGAGTNAASSSGGMNIGHYATSTGWDMEYRGGFMMNTTTLSDDVTITNATLSLPYQQKWDQLNSNPNYSVIDWTPANPVSYVAADYSATTFARQADDITEASMSGAGFKNWAIYSDKLTRINKTWYTGYIGTMNQTVENLTPPWVASSNTVIIFEGNDSAGSIKRPYLTVDYALTSAPIANFTSNVTSGSAPLAVGFTDTSTNTPIAWNWSYNTSNMAKYTEEFTNGIYWNTSDLTITPNAAIAPDGTMTADRFQSTTNDQNSQQEIAVSPNTNYTFSWYTKNNGGEGADNGLIYDVTHTTMIVNQPSYTPSSTWERRNLSFRTPDGTTSIIVYPYYSSWGQTGDCYVWGIQLERGDTPTLYNKTEATAPIVQYFSTAQNSEYTFTSQGNYTIFLNATNSAGSNTTPWGAHWINVTAPVSAPTADFMGQPTTGSVPLEVTFTDLSTGDGISAWNWSLGDGNYNETQHPTHTYSSFGNYTVNLTVTGTGGSDYELKQGYILVTNATPVANFTSNVTTGCAPLSVLFNDTSTGTGLNWSWKVNGAEVGTEQNLSYVFTNPGLYEWVNLTVANDGGSDTMSWQDSIYATSCAPPASITGLTNDTTTCEQLTFNWTNPADADFNHTYVMQDGIFDQNISNASHSITWAGLTGGIPVLFSSRTVDTDGYMNASWVNMTATPTTCGDTTPPANISALGGTVVSCSEIDWTWSNPSDLDYAKVMIWRNGVWYQNVSNASESVPWTGLAESTSYTFSTHTVDTSENVNTTWVNATRITDACPTPPVADFIADNQSICAGDTVQFTDMSSYTPTSWLWLFGDGGNDNVQNPSYQYLNVGTFDVSLKAINSDGSDWENKTGFITASDCAPTAGFTADNTSVCADAPIQFTSTSTGGPTNFDWYPWANETKASDLEDPIFSFNVTGQYSIRLYVQNTYGDDFENKTDYITINDCTPDTTPPGTVVNLTGNASACGVSNWVWEDPSDADFQSVHLWLNDVDKGWINKGVQAYDIAYKSTGNYTVSTQTRDTIGNINTTWVNDTVYITSCSSGNATSSGGSGGGGEAIGAVAGLIGGLLGGIMIVRRYIEEKENGDKHP